MTTEEAIEVLSQYFTHRHNPDVIQQALDEAIEVMERDVLLKQKINSFKGFLDEVSINELNEMLK